VETKWLEDFVSLAETRSFSRSAQLRHVTQPAFSRRIQALEAWAGVDLLDRSAYPTGLTRAGQTLLPQAMDMLTTLNNTRQMLRTQQGAGQDVLDFAIPHTLAFTFFPHWLTEIRDRFGPIRSRLMAMNVHDAVMLLTEGNCDVLIAYHHDAQPLQLNPERYEMLTLGQETLAPFCAADARGQARFALPADGRPVPYLAYASGAYLGRLVENLVREALNRNQPLRLDCVYETDMAESLKAMALEGHGVAFLPTSSVGRDALAPQRPQGLVRASPPGVLETTMDIRIYRERPALARHPKPQAKALWQFLMKHLHGSEPAATAHNSTPEAS
jgi:DNA-binding transcriptional LysR family regulator